MSQDKAAPMFVVRLTNHAGHTTGYAIVQQVALVPCGPGNADEHAAMSSFDALFATADAPLAALSYSARKDDGGCYTAASGFPLS